MVGVVRAPANLCSLMGLIMVFLTRRSDSALGTAQEDVNQASLGFEPARPCRE